MSRQMLAIVATLLVTFGFGFGAGLYFGGGDSIAQSKTDRAPDSSSGSSLSADEQNDEKGNTLLSSRIRELEKVLAEQNAKQQGAALDRMAFFEKYHEKINLQPFDQNMKLTPEMTELLGISDQQKHAIEQHLAETKGRLDKIQDADTTLTKQTDTSVSYEVASDKEGDALKEQLRSELSGDVGDDKAKLFMAYSNGWSFNSQFSGFLEDKRQIDISWKPQSGTSGGSIYTTQVTSKTGTWSMTGTVQPEFQKYLPDGIKP